MGCGLRTPSDIRLHDCSFVRAVNSLPGRRGLSVAGQPPSMRSAPLAAVIRCEACLDLPQPDERFIRQYVKSQSSPDYP